MQQEDEECFIMWKIHLDREDSDEYSYSITLNEEYGGWRTDSGYPGYGLPKDLAQWICDILNKHQDECPFNMDSGYWEKK